MSFINPPPPVRIPTKCGKFAVEENDLFSFSLIFGPPIGVDNLDLVEVSLYLPKRPFPYSKTSRMSAYCVALHWEGKGSIMPL